jgi:hypothetical protein
MEQVKVQVIEITRMAQTKLFQMKVPMDATKIVGIETGVQQISKPADLIPVVAFPPTEIPVLLPVYGCLTLQSCDKSNLFYSAIIKDEMSREDYSIPHLSMSTGLPPSFEQKIAQDIILNAGTTVIAGCFKDYFGEALYTHARYKVMLAVWFEIEPEKKKINAHDH